ncbi:hypothetical protein E2C01_044117 [Portunus trituberculatus]|uniref:Uncharacterized protein n=1 Tax=Portunus trituberculatus TaxID=210409 RepID=A0A5B7FZ32_PORTR|nr:hypothetical protein [Portunus trituberculatus]
MMCTEKDIFNYSLTFLHFSLTRSFHLSYTLNGPAAPYLLSSTLTLVMGKARDSLLMLILTVLLV